ncbi:MAG: hypothetical protein IKJ60_06250 [Ruminococcus sp.]|nr:hypothetical protein [Ruminococcus sp.]
MDTILLSTLGMLYVYGYLNLAMRYIKLIKNKEKVKVKKMDKNHSIILYVLVFIWLVTKVIREFGDRYFVLWCVILVLEAVYTIVIQINSKYAYICNDCIIFEDCSKKAKDYSYQINDDILEILPDKPPRNVYKFIIEEDKGLLIDILKNYKLFK